MVVCFFVGYLVSDYTSLSVDDTEPIGIAYTDLREEQLFTPILTYMGKLRVTAYCKEDYTHICNNGTALTNASGLPHEVGVIVASNTIPMYTKIYIEGVGFRIVGDYGASDADILMDYHEDALQFGVKHLDVWVVSK
jgi:3D (Asp-Asp-Asp) domain-containing protein